MRPRMILCLILSLHICKINSQTNLGEYALKIKVKERKDNHLIFDYKIDIKTAKSDSHEFVGIPLPFGYNPDLKIIIEPESDHNMIYYGFLRSESMGGVCKIGLLNKKSNILITIKNADLTLKETGKNDNVEAATISFNNAYNWLQSEKFDTSKILKLKSMTIYSGEIKNTMPESKLLSDDSPNEHVIYLSSEYSYNDNITLFLSQKEKSKKGVQSIFFFIALTITLLSTPSIISNSINLSIVFSSASLIFLIILVIFFINEVYSTSVVNEYDLSGGIMAGIGLFLGLFINSFRNVLRLRRVNRVQGTT